MRVRSRRIPLFVFALSAIGLGVLLSSQNRVRLIVGSYQLVDSTESLNWPPSSETSIRRFRGTSLSNSPTLHSSVSEEGRACSILSNYAAAHPRRTEDAMPALDDPDTCLALISAGHILHCYNDDIAANELLARYSIYTRLWDLSGPGDLGGNGHNILEVWNGKSHIWQALDPYYHCYYIQDSDSTALSVRTMRRLLLTAPSRVHLVHYVADSLERPEPYVISELKYLAPTAMLHATNDFRWRYDHRYGMLMLLAPLIDRLPLRVTRGLRTAMLGSDDTRYMIKDSMSPDRPFAAMKIIFYSLLAAFLVSGSTPIVSAWRRRSR